MPARWEPGPTLTSSRSAPTSSSEVDSTARSTSWWAAITPSRRATQGSVGACTSVKITTRDEDEVEEPHHPGCADQSRHGGQHDGHGTAQASPGQEGVLAPRQPEGATREQHRQGPCDEEQDRAERHRRPQLRHELLRVREQAEQHEEPDLGQPAECGAQADEGGPVRQVEIAQHERRHITGREATEVEPIGQTVGHDRDRDDADGEDGRGAAGDRLEQATPASR